MVYQERVAISLHDAQFPQGSDSRQPIPEDMQDEVIAHISRFKRTCLDFGVLESNIAVLATAATRLAPNSREFMTNIERATGWHVQLLPQEEDGLLGAWGVVSSLPNVEGLVIDLGGGSMQMSWVSKDGDMQKSVTGVVSLPYGAATLPREDMNPSTELARDMQNNIQKACATLRGPESTSQLDGTDLYLTGGGFRAWGHLLMSTSEQYPYPIPMINGFKTDSKDFKKRDFMISTLNAIDRGHEAFRISQRRATQLPAVANLVMSITQTIPSIRNVWFCQGGIREGFLFNILPPEICSHDPLVVATMPHRTTGSDSISSILQTAFPMARDSEPAKSFIPTTLNASFVTAFSNTMYAHSTVPKDSRPATALRCTTTGLLASAQGLSHENRALLALALYERWSGDLLPPDEELLESMRRMMSMEEVWWCKYLGRVAAALAEAYPAGIVPAAETDPRISFKASLESKARPRKGGMKHTLKLVIKVAELTVTRESLKRIEKLGKKKNWARAEGRRKEMNLEDWGLKVDVDMRWK